MPPLRYSIFKPKLSNSVIKKFDLTASHYRSHDLNMWEKYLQPQSLNLSSPRCAQPKFLKIPKKNGNKNINSRPSISSRRIPKDEAEK